MMNEHDDWDKHWDDLTHSCRYIPAQGFRRLLVIRWLQRQKPTPNDRLVDIGSGQGDLIADLTHLFPTLDLAGSEMSAIGIEQSKVKSPKAHFFQHDLTLPPAPDDPLSGWARWAVCCEVLEHVDEPEKVLAHASQFLAPGARLFITVPGGPISAFDRHIGHRKHFTTESLTKLVRDAGLIPEKVTGVGFPFFNLYRMTVILRGKALIKDASGEYNETLPWYAKIAMSLFSIVLKPEWNSSSSGWQMTAQARKPEKA